jgi:LmbE family N-acetylglucosaminyl deacetylase
MRIAAVFAHPADMATEAGGTLALHAQQGDEVKVIILTHGGRLHPNVYIEAQRKNPDAPENAIAHAQRDQILEIKYREMQQSARILGVAEIVCLEVEDTMGTVNHALIERTAEYLSLWKPELLITHHPGYASGVGSDHCISGQIAMAASFRISHQFSNLDDKEPCFIRQIFFIGNGISSRSSIDPGGGAFNDLYIDITTVVEKKIHAMDCFVSQGYNGDYARKCVAGHNGHWGSLAGVTFAEPFIRNNAETHGLLPLSAVNQKRDEVTMHRGYSQNANVWNL